MLKKFGRAIKIKTFKRTFNGSSTTDRLLRITTKYRKKIITTDQIKILKGKKYKSELKKILNFFVSILIIPCTST
ncbi:hypothetical protein BpHYR1_008438 [Brachionus plicatilis]|uniref:Uncharacterized protein n=1 Tax=Brachionus plicatilis TaxID=10195 RepID=A0A3M7SB68_BRAPC|nr:hypothetical protein BpHYR1_008438 [Brachionus plicatilis]